MLFYNICINSIATLYTSLPSAVICLRLKGSCYSFWLHRLLYRRVLFIVKLFHSSFPFIIFHCYLPSCTFLYFFLLFSFLFPSPFLQHYSLFLLHIYFNFKLLIFLFCYFRCILPFDYSSALIFISQSPSAIIEKHG